MPWERLSVRSGRAPREALYEGVPEHLRSPVIYWMQGVFGYRDGRGMREGTMRNVAMGVRLHLPYGVNRDVQIQDYIIKQCIEDEELFLDVIDCILDQVSGAGSNLDKVLTVGGSAWRVADGGESLQRRVEAAASDAASDAMAPGDVAAQELSEAWAAAYGRTPNPSDAWDHAIKAVEAVLIPIVVPKQDKPQLGHVLGQLRSNGSGWKFILPGANQNHVVAPLVAAIEAVWPNPDRHANANARPPTLDESQCALHTAVTIVQWARKPDFLLRS